MDPLKIIYTLVLNFKFSRSFGMFYIAIMQLWPTLCMHISHKLLMWRFYRVGMQGEKIQYDIVEFQQEFRVQSQMWLYFNLGVHIC